MSGTIASINISSGGVPKRPVDAARVGSLGLEGDNHTDTVHHGGVDRAVCLFSLEQIDALTLEGHRIAPGTIGENVTVTGLPWAGVGPGARYRLGEQVVIEVTSYTSPCHKIQASFLGRDYARVSQKRRPGWSRVYARVLAEGMIRRGDPVVRLPTGAAPAV